MKKITKEEFIKKSNFVHNNKYDYSLVNYINSFTKLKIICPEPEHGEFEQQPNAHTIGKQGCPKCSKYSPNNLSSFIKKSNIGHNNKYDYSLVIYEDSHTKVKIICPIHGVFEQAPMNHSNNKQGCPSCGGVKKLSTEEFIEKSKLIHNNKYDYSMVEYKNNKIKVKIICPIHGVFNQSPSVHLNGSVCPKCSYDNRRKFLNFINKSKIKYNNKYDYSLVDYKRTDKPVKIICSIHGTFEQRPTSHLKNGCPLCEGNMKLTTEQIIYQFKQIHGDKYDYSLVNYINDKTKVDIICKKHGVFKQNPSFHKIGGGCPICKESRGEQKVSTILKKMNINFTKQKKFKSCKNERELPFDFYLPDYNMCIEYDGKHHFEDTIFWGKDENRLSRTQLHDQIKNKFCEENNINLIRIKWDDNIYEKLLKYLS